MSKSKFYPAPQFYEFNGLEMINLKGVESNSDGYTEVELVYFLFSIN